MGVGVGVGRGGENSVRDHRLLIAPTTFEVKSRTQRTCLSVRPGVSWPGCLPATLGPVSAGRTGGVDCCSVRAGKEQQWPGCAQLAALNAPLPCFFFRHRKKARAKPIPVPALLQLPPSCN